MPYGLSDLIVTYEPCDFYLNLNYVRNSSMRTRNIDDFDIEI